MKETTVKKVLLEVYYDDTVGGPEFAIVEIEPGELLEKSELVKKLREEHNVSFLAWADSTPRWYGEVDGPAAKALYSNGCCALRQGCNPKKPYDVECVTLCIGTEVVWWEGYWGDTHCSTANISVKFLKEVRGVL